MQRQRSSPGLRRIGKGRVEPGREPGDQPFALRADRRVGGDHHAAALVRILAAQPAHGETHVGLRQLRALVEADEVVRPALPGQLRSRPFQRAELDQPPVELQHHVDRVVARARAADRDQPLLHAVQVHIGAAADQRAAMRREAEPEHQVALAAAGRAAIEQQVRLGVVGVELRLVGRLRRPRRGDLVHVQRLDQLPLLRARLGERSLDGGRVDTRLRLHRGSPPLSSAPFTFLTKAASARARWRRRYRAASPASARTSRPITSRNWSASAATARSTLRSRARPRIACSAADFAVVPQDRLAHGEEAPAPLLRAPRIARRIQPADVLMRDRDPELALRLVPDLARRFECGEPHHDLVAMRCGQLLVP